MKTTEKHLFLVYSCYNKDMLSNHRFNPKEFKVGMRTIKSGIAVFLVILLFKLFGWEGTQIAALTAVFSLREDFDQSLHFGASRVLGNAIGGCYALLYFGMERFLPEHFLVTLLVVPLAVMLTIMTNVAMNNKVGVVGGVAALLIIVLSVPSGDSFVYVLIRVAETFCGVFVAMVVNVDMKWLQQHLLKK